MGDAGRDTDVSDSGVDSSRVTFERSLTFRRRMGRFGAVQAMYMYDVELKLGDLNPQHLNKSADQVSADLTESVLYFYKNIFLNKDNWDTVDGKYRKIDEKYLKEILLDVISNIDHVDGIISKHLNERWTIDRIDMPLRSILRCAVAEILYNSRVDVPILTSEYTNMTSYFFGDRQVGFVNGIVDKIAKSYRKRS